MRQCQHRQSDGEAGFTLIEMLVALVLTVGILTALASITSQWLPNWDRGFAHVQRTELTGLGIERLVADLSASEFVTANGKSKEPLFEGNELGVRFVRSAIGPNTRPGLEVVNIATTSGEQGLTLVRTRTPFMLLPENGTLKDLSNFSDPVVLIRAPYRVIFSYAGPDRVWQNSWQGADQLPDAVRISVHDAATEQTLAVSTATLLHVTASPECARAKNPRDCLNPSSNAPTNTPVNAPTAGRN
jgi:general secretion pathway protein J